MNIYKLSAYDFPSIDVAKFNEWKALHLKANRDVIIVTLLAVATMSVWYSVSGSSTIPLFIAIVPGAFAGIRRKRERQLKEDLKISERWQAKKEGRAFTG
jgi:hypothetical protein